MAACDPAVHVVEFPDVGRGQQAVRDIRAGEVVLEVSLAENCWTAALAASSPELRCISDGACQGLISERDLIALHLAVSWSDEAPPGPRADHARELSSTRLDLPLMWSDEELHYLSGQMSPHCLRSLRAACRLASSHLGLFRPYPSVPTQLALLVFRRPFFSSATSFRA